MSDPTPSVAAKTRAVTLFVQLARAADLVSSEVSPALVREGLTHGQLGVLEILAAEGSLNLRQLGLRLYRSPPNMTIVVDNLERAGLVQRERDRRDRRIVLVSITADGKKRFAEAFPDFAQRLAMVFARLSAGEQVSLSRLCAKLRNKKAREAAVK